MLTDGILNINLKKFSEAQAILLSDFLEQIRHYASFIIPCACAKGKVIGSAVVVIVVNQKINKIARSRHLGTLATRKHNNSVELGENWPHCASNRVAWPTSVTNSVFLLDIVATPLDRAYYYASAVYV